MYTNTSSRLNTADSITSFGTGVARPRTGYSMGTRPWTGQSRPATGRPTTAASTTRHEASYVVALLEGRGVSREIGMAALDKDTGLCVLVQIADCQTYVKTLHQLHLHPPAVVLVPDTFLSIQDPAFVNSVGGGHGVNVGRKVKGIGNGGMGGVLTSSSLLVEYVREEFPNAVVEAVGRKYWNDTGGLEFVTQLCVEGDERAATILAASNKYYALSAACALFKYAESQLNVRFASNSLRIKYIPVEGTMMIDPETVKNLELVKNVMNLKSSHTLFGTLNYSFTAMGGRLLRVNILSPLTDQQAVNARLDVVAEFVQNEDRFSDVREALKLLNKMDFDKLIASLASSEARPTSTAKGAFARVTQMLNLRNLVKYIPSLKRALAGSESQLLRIVHEMISDERLTIIEQLVCTNLNEETIAAKGGIGAVNARVYAVRANCNKLLDVARETYKENVSDIYELNKMLADEHELPITLMYQDGGFTFVLKKTPLIGEPPKGFISVSSRKGKWLFSSMELKKLNARMKDALDETLILSDKIIQDLVSEIVTEIGALYKASEAVALVDMLWSFSHASIMRNYIRPEFTGTLAIKSGRHPILETVQAAGMLVPNDVYCDDASSFQVIQGPNMSGKSTYLRQIGLLTVMAMCGSFVPAEYASFRLHDCLLTRLSNDDDLEKSLSTFASEMTTSAMILGMATPMSLVLVDELGRGTSPRDGLGISHAIAEALIVVKSFVFFATHYKELKTTLSRQPTVINLHLSVHQTRKTSSNFGLTFQYKIVDGASEDYGHYGLELARLADLPDDVITEARRVAEHLAQVHAQNEEESESSKVAKRRKALLKLKAQLTQAHDHSALPDKDLRAYVGRFKNDIIRAFMQ
ncbi:hypothetical protein Agabi119p4_8722 [Agaricus bisporus var. burnettii]|uniref:DNA mismatch repair protein MSH3 n=1 Tax=Agaricus bisporus var. burnettii TaxID=192524 RepID=A0A8H7EXG5_AGABI|nr:hypothetical protein Agabi119p4_8722 [Agaricus bisporus var. burnettii]